MVAVTICSDFGAQEDKISPSICMFVYLYVYVPPSICMNSMGQGDIIQPLKKRKFWHVV